MVNVIIGVLGLQGAIEDHEKSVTLAAEKLGIELDLRRVILPKEIEEVDGLIMPGGESTAMTLIGSKNGMIDAVNKKLDEGLPAFGTCAGAILLSKRVRRKAGSDETSGAFPYLVAEIYRNGYGRQRDSFTTNIQLKGIDFKAIFIRAPVFGLLGKGVEVLAQVENDPVFIKQENIFATTFHPELAGDTKIHEIFLKAVVENKTS